MQRVMKNIRHSTELQNRICINIDTVFEKSYFKYRAIWLLGIWLHSQSMISCTSKSNPLIRACKMFLHIQKLVLPPDKHKSPQLSISLWHKILMFKQFERHWTFRLQNIKPSGICKQMKQNFLQNESIFTFLLLTNWSQDKINCMQNNIHNILITCK